MAKTKKDLTRARRILGQLIAPEKSFINVALIYGVAIALLTLSVPIAVQTLVNSVANLASLRAILILTGILFVLLSISALLTALRTRVMEMYERHVYARLSSQLGLHILLAEDTVFEGRRNVTLIHRFFDILTLQSNIPLLVVDGFALVLQLIVGFTLVSFYHPALFALNLIIIVLIYLVWIFFAQDAKLTALEKSKAKYETSKWLSQISSAHEFFQSKRHLDLAGKSTEARVADYVHWHRRHFTFTFSQVVCFLIIYVLASSTLLGLGGWLVIQGQLSIGQLVAAELIMSAVFFGLTQFANYMQMYYELYGAADKLGEILELPQLAINEDAATSVDNGDLECRNLIIDYFGQEITLDFTLKSHAKLFVDSEKTWISQQLTRLLKTQIEAKKGAILLADIELVDYDLFSLRKDIMFVDRSLIVECRISDYLKLAAPGSGSAKMRSALEAVGLAEVIDALPDELDTLISPAGAPLQPMDMLRLKLAAALLAQPKLVVLTEEFDNISETERLELLDRLKTETFSLIYFTNRPVEDKLNGILVCSLTEPGNAGDGLVFAPVNNAAPAEGTRHE